MNNTHRKRTPLTTPLRLAVETPADESTTLMVEMLQEHLRLVREGQIRSLAIVSVSQDGSSVGTQWSCGSADSASLIGKLTVLTHDLMASRE
jgi:hypothetical protein